MRRFNVVIRHGRGGRPRLQTASTALLGVVAASLLVGCKVGPDYQGPPPACLGNSWRSPTLEDSAIRPEFRDLSTWWLAFDDPVLDALIEEAVAANLNLREAAMRIFEARARRCTVRADLLPQITQDASYSYAKFAQTGSSLAADATSDQWSFGLSGTWEIDVFGRLRRLVEAADADIRFSVEDYRDTLVILVADVATNYLDARTFQRRLQIARENLEIQQRTLELTEKRFRAELTSELDVAQARANVETTASDIPSLQTGYQQALNRLSVLLGCPPGEVDPALEEPAPIPTTAGEIAVGIPADLLRRRPDIRRAESQLVAQNARVGAAIGEMYPKFTLLGSFGLDAQDFSKLLDADAISASIGPSMRWNIFSFGKLRCNVYVERWSAQQQAVQYERAVLTAAEEVDNALTSYVNEKQRRERLAASVDANRRAVALAEKRYVGGDVSFQRVLDSQRSQLLAQDQLALSEAQVTASLIQLYRSLGGGWQLPQAICPRPLQTEPPPAPQPQPLQSAAPPSAPPEPEADADEPAATEPEVIDTPAPEPLEPQPE